MRDSTVAHFQVRAEVVCGLHCEVNTEQDGNVNPGLIMAQLTHVRSVLHLCNESLTEDRWEYPNLRAE